jgi:hypothetical protein
LMSKAMQIWYSGLHAPHFVILVTPKLTIHWGTYSLFWYLMIVTYVLNGSVQCKNPHL